MKKILLLLTCLTLASCGEDINPEVWNLNFSNGISTSNYTFTLPNNFQEKETSACLICCSGNITTWNEIDKQLNAVTTCSGGNNANTEFSGIITGDSIKGNWITIWTSGNSDAGTFTGTRQP